MEERESTTLSPRHGENSTASICFFCNRPKGAVRFGHIRGMMKAELIETLRLCGRNDEADKMAGSDDPKVPRWMCLDSKPCAECAAWMKKGVLLISVKDGVTSPTEAYRTGGFAVVKEEVIPKMFPEEDAKKILKRRAAFVRDSLWERVGLNKLEPTEA